MKVLICEDGEVLLTALEFRLQKNGYEIQLAKDGQEALDMVKASRPDLMVADLEASKVSGLELLRTVRKDLKSDLPFVLLADLDYDEQILEAFRLGATDFVSKPFNPNELILRIRRIFEQDEPVK